MNLEKVIFGFFVLLAATLNFGFFLGDISVPSLHNIYELFGALVVSLIATVLKFGDRTQLGATHLATSLVADLQLICAALVWGYAANVSAHGVTPEAMASVVSLSGGALLANVVSVILLGISVWIRLSLAESPTFKRMKEEGKGSKAPLSEAFGQWKNAKIALLALFGLTAGQAVVWYNGQFYALFFLNSVLKLDLQTVNIMIAIALAIGSIFFVVFGWLSDKIGRKPIIMAGFVLAILTTFPLFKALTWAANPALASAQQNVRATVTAAPGDCRFQFNPVGTAKFTTSCDVATAFLTRNSVPYDVVSTAAPGTAASVKIGQETVESFDVIAAGDQAKAKEAAFTKSVYIALHDGGYPMKRAAAKVADQKLDAFVAANPELNLDAAAIRSGEKASVPVAQAVKDKLLTEEEATGAPEATVYTIPNAGAFSMFADPAQINWPLTIAILFVLVLYVTMVYGPIAAILVEMFPTRIRYTGMSLPYHIGNGWFGGLLPATVFALSAYKGDIYYGLWYPVAIAAMSLVIGVIFVKDTLGTNLHTKE